MKRNHPPDDLDCCPENERNIIDSRLEGLFSVSAGSQRRIPLSSKGVWLDGYRHVKIDSTKGVMREFINRSREFHYDYLNPYEALYCLETSQLLIYFNGLPLSLSEAYQLLLDGHEDFIRYRVFQQLNRSGYVCLKPYSEEGCPSVQTKAREECCDKSNATLETDHRSHVVGLKPLAKVDSESNIVSILGDLQRHGPQEFDMSGGRSGISFEGLKISFDVYKREDLNRHKPRRFKQGSPDYHLVVCDRSDERVPECGQLLKYDLQREQCTRKELIFALVDDDLSICFAQFKPLNPTNLL